MTALFSAINPSLAASESPNPRRIDGSCGNKKAPARFRLRVRVCSHRGGNPPPPSTVVAVAIIREGQKDSDACRLSNADVCVCACCSA